MPQFLALIYTPETDWSDPAQGPVMAEYGAFGQAAAAIIRGGAVLYPTTTATTVRVAGGKGGKLALSDGPYTETKEVLSGFYQLECADLDEAVATAAAIPAAWTGGAVEVRPVIEW